MAIENKNSRLPKVTCLLNVNSTRSPFSHPCIYLRTLQRLGVRQQKKVLFLPYNFILFYFPPEEEQPFWMEIDLLMETRSVR